MSLVVDDFNNPSKWTDYIIGTGVVRNKTYDTFETEVLVEGDQAGLVSIQSIDILGQDIRVRTTANSVISGLTLDSGFGSPTGIGYTIQRNQDYGEVHVWMGAGHVASIPDTVPLGQPAELRITAEIHPEYPLGLISFYYEGALIYQAEMISWVETPQYVYLLSIATSIATITGVNIFQSTEYVPPTYTLSINSNPSGIPFTIKEIGMSYVTPWSGVLGEGIYEIEMPSNVIVGADTYNFVQWEDTSTNPLRIINLTSDLLLSATYQLQQITALDVHAFLDGEEVIADGLIVETGYMFNTPEIINVVPGQYTIRLTYLGVTKEYIASPSDGETIRVDGQMTKPKISIAPYLTLILIAGLVYLKFRK